MIYAKPLNMHGSHGGGEFRKIDENAITELGNYREGCCAGGDEGGNFYRLEREEVWFFSRIDLLVTL